MKPVRAVALLAVTCLLTSCATLGRQAFSPPIVTVTDVRLAGIGLNGGRIDVHLSMYNPNNFRLDASQIRYRLLVDSVQLAEGVIDQQINLGRKDSASLMIPVSFGLREAYTTAGLLASGGALPFQLVGDLRVLTPFGSVRRGFDQRGTYEGLDVSLVGR